MTTTKEKIQNIQDQLNTLLSAVNDLKITSSLHHEETFEEEMKKKVKQAKSWDEIKKNFIVHKYDIVEYTLYNANLDIVKDMISDKEFEDDPSMFCQVQSEVESMPPFPVFKYMVENHMPNVEFSGRFCEAIIGDRTEHLKFILTRLKNSIADELRYYNINIDPTQKQFDVVTSLLDGEEKEEWLRSEFNPSLK